MQHIRLGLGILNYKRDQLDVAERHFRQAAQLMPYDPAPHTYLASIYFKHKRFKDCAAEAEVSLKLCPTDLRALYLKASVLSSLGKVSSIEGPRYAHPLPFPSLTFARLQIVIANNVIGGGGSVHFGLHQVPRAARPHVALADRGTSE